LSGRTVPLVVHAIYRLDFGGLENGLVNLVNRLPRDRFRHAIVTLAGVNPEFAARLRRDDVRIESLDKRPGKDVAMYGRMWRTLRRLRPDILHTRNLGTLDLQWVGAAAGVRHRVHGEHGWEASDPQGRNPRSLRIRRACRPLVHRYVPMSQDIARWLERDVGVEPGRIRQLYSGVDTERFSPRSATAGQSPGGDEVVVGTVGRLDPVKNQASLIDAVARLRTTYRGVRLVIVGDGPLHATLESRAAAAGVADIVSFAGARSDTPDLLRSFDVFVLPSINEGISNTILEAMATGLPVVAGRVGGNAELVVEGVTGALYSPDKGPATLDAVIATYLANPALRLRHGEAGRQRVVQNFSLDAMIARYAALYDELLAEA
jgi:sugar transferase (PEP-CTERM/EpsH1 system associated)